MRSTFHALAPLVLGLSTLAAQSTTFGPVLSVAERTWPEKNRIGVVCNYRSSGDQIADMVQSASSGSVITVVDAASVNATHAAQNILRNHNIDYLVMLPHDPVFFEGGFAATMLVGRLATKGIPSVGTRPIGLKQGAVFCIGPETHGELLVTDKLVGTVSVILPSRVAKVLQPAPLFSSASLSPRGATLNLIQSALLQ